MRDSRCRLKSATSRPASGSSLTDLAAERYRSNDGWSLTICPIFSAESRMLCVSVAMARDSLCKRFTIMIAQGVSNKSQRVPQSRPAAHRMPDFQRYHRQMLLPQIGEAGQRRLTAARVLLIGCGALGTTIAEQ